MDGELVAAQAEDDTRHILRRLTVERFLANARARELMAMAEMAEPILGYLFDEVPGQALEQALFDRFVENICRFVSRSSRPRFEEMAAIFVDNIQMGHDSQQLVEWCTELADRAASVDPELEIVAGPIEPNDPREAWVVECVGQGNLVRKVMLQLPLEPLCARAYLAELIDTGTLALFGASPQEEPTERGEPEEEPSEEVPDEPDDPDPDAVNTLPPQEIDLSSLEAWKETTHVVHDDDLEAFGDYDSVRGGDDDAGGFSTESHNLDRVEVANLDEVLAADEGPAVRFSAPALTEDDAVAKVEVTNDVLVTISTALDQTGGSGRGHATIQLLLEGGPTKFAPLFGDLTASDDGALPINAVLRNLHHRPPGEHRMLLNQGLTNLIERALSSAADELPDDSFEHVLENVAGYRQRLGL